MTEDTDLTGLSESLASSAPNDGVQGPADAHSSASGMEELPLEAKLLALQEMFPTIRDFDRQYALKQTGDNFGKAIEILLNHAFLEEESTSSGTPLVHRGIDGFASLEDDRAARGRRGKARRKNASRRTSSTPAVQFSGSEVSQSSRWDRAKEDVDFIAERIHMAPKSVSSIYHKSGASLSATIAMLCTLPESTSSNPLLASAPLSIIEAHAAQLSGDFPQIPYTYLEALIRMTHPSEASAHELAKAMLHSIDSSPTTTTIIPQYTPRSTSPPLPSPPFEARRPLSIAMASNMATARSNAFSQANAAYRKSKSKPLMGGAAAYYSSVGRDAATALAQHEAATADALVSGQSKVGEVDLHGVNVRDAVRITQTKVQAWWDGGAAEWARQGKVQGDGGLRVVTGVGRHSTGGRSRLGPAVGAMLVREGWKIEVGEGVVTVRGRARK